MHGKTIGSSQLGRGARRGESTAATPCDRGGIDLSVAATAALISQIELGLSPVAAWRLLAKDQAEALAWLMPALQLARSQGLDARPLLRSLQRQLRRLGRRSRDYQRLAAMLRWRLLLALSLSLGLRVVYGFHIAQNSPEDVALDWQACLPLLLAMLWAAFGLYCIPLLRPKSWLGEPLGKAPIAAVWARAFVNQAWPAAKLVPDEKMPASLGPASATNFHLWAKIQQDRDDMTRQRRLDCLPLGELLFIGAPAGLVLLEPLLRLVA